MIGKSLVVSTYTTNKLIQVIGEGGNVDWNQYITPKRYYFSLLHAH